MGEGEALYDQDTSNYRLSCPWNYSAAGRLVTVVGVGLVVVAIVSCCFSGLLSEEEESSRQVGSKKSEVSIPLIFYVSLFMCVFSLYSSCRCV